MCERYLTPSRLLLPLYLIDFFIEIELHNDSRHNERTNKIINNNLILFEFKMYDIHRYDVHRNKFAIEVNLHRSTLLCIEKK